ncbi:DUF1800 domain-containing protein [Sphingomonas bacterium]|uniref:DUF1800 domain-containing protein n=1 Tax=Sphingomonas bacterium TaxID=1895847 RepID=UPI0015757781|nr:DUF1800 family protein [Sphingomonas bacterium]
MLLASCGGGSGGGSTTDSGAAAASSAATAQQAAAQKLALETDVSRLAKQATFGATPALIDHMKAVGVSAWLDEQFAATGSRYSDIAADKLAVNACTTPDNGACFRHHFTRETVAMRFYANALSQPDQLRQRVAFALSQLVVASTLQVGNAQGSAGFNQILLDNAFGNYRTLLTSVTLNAFMGDYLDMVNSSKTAPSENYAREMLQLFSMGTDQLNMDGTPVLDSTGARVANYTPEDVKGVARALTGWTFAHFSNGTTYVDYDYAVQMIPAPNAYDATAKSFLGVTVAAGATQMASVQAAVDAAFNNASTAPFIAKFLIKQLVTSNPSAAYVGRVAAVFANNGSNVRGDLKAVIRAILTDAEARGSAGTTDNYGKVKEPVLLMTQLARAINMTTDGKIFSNYDGTMGEAVFASPSVFNFYPPDYPLPQSTLESPASKLLSAGTILPRANFVYNWTIGAATTRSEFNTEANVTGATGSAIDWSSWEAFGTDIDGMIDRIDLILASRTLTADQKTALKNAANAVTNSNATQQARLRAQAMLYIYVSSPLFQVDR